MSNSDLILHLVEQLIVEKEKNIRLEYEKKYQQQMQMNNSAKTNM